MAELTGSSEVPYQARAADTLRALRREIDFHREHDRSKSYIGRAVDGAVGLFATKSEKTYKEIESLYRESQQAQATGDRETLDKVAKQVAAAIRADQAALAARDEIDRYASGFVKTASLFMRGRLGLAGTVAAYALDQMNPDDGWKTQALDGLLGASKGALLKGTFKALGEAELGIAAKGVSLGVASRVLEMGLARNTYTDPTTGQFSLSKGLAKTLDGSLDKSALLSDVLIFGVAHGLSDAANCLTMGALRRSPILSTVFTGATFGLSSGAYNEIARQQHAGEAFDLGKIVKRSLIQGTLDSFAATPGGFQARAAFPNMQQSSEQRSESEPYDRLATSDEYTLREQARTRLIADENLDEFSRLVKRSTVWWEDPGAAGARAITRFVRSAVAYARFQGCEAEVRSLMDKEVGMPQGNFDAAEFRGRYFQDKPDLLKAYDRYLSAKRYYSVEVKTAREEPLARAQELGEEVNSFLESRGLPPVWLSTQHRPGASYNPGKGFMFVEGAALTRAKPALIAELLLHEIVHHEQDTLLINMYADEVARQSTGTGRQGFFASSERSKIAELYQHNTGLPLQGFQLSRALEMRNGVELSVTDLARARDLEAAAQVVLPDRKVPSSNLDMVNRALVALEKDGTAQAVLSAWLRNPNAAERVLGEKIPADITTLLESAKTGRSWDDERAVSLLKTHLSKRAHDLKKQYNDAYDAYRAIAYEKEAWAAGELARRAVEAQSAESYAEAARRRMRFNPLLLKITSATGSGSAS